MTRRRQHCSTKKEELRGEGREENGGGGARGKRREEREEAKGGSLLGRVRFFHCFFSSNNRRELLLSLLSPCRRPNFDRRASHMLSSASLRQAGLQSRPAAASCGPHPSVASPPRPLLNAPRTRIVAAAATR